MSRLSKHRKNQKQDLPDIDVPNDVAKAVKKLPEQDRNIVIQALAVKKTHSGPLPDSETIKVYSEVIPNGGERLMANVEKQLEHRHELEKKGLTEALIKVQQDNG